MGRFGARLIQLSLFETLYGNPGFLGQWAAPAASPRRERRIAPDKETPVGFTGPVSCRRTGQTAGALHRKTLAGENEKFLYI